MRTSAAAPCRSCQVARTTCTVLLAPTPESFCRAGKTRANADAEPLTGRSPASRPEPGPSNKGEVHARRVTNDQTQADVAVAARGAGARGGGLAGIRACGRR